MSSNTNAIFPKLPNVFNASLAAVTACSTRAPTPFASLAGANISVLVPTGASQIPVNTESTRIDRIQVQACSTSITATTAAQLVQIWEYDGTNAWLIDEIEITAKAPTTTTPAFVKSVDYTKLVIPVTHAIYISTTVTTTAATTALCVTAFAGIY